MGRHHPAIGQVGVEAEPDQRYALGLNPALLLGSITGAMTSTPSLKVVTELAHSSVPALGYAGTYTFANVLLTFAGTVLMML